MVLYSSPLRKITIKYKIIYYNPLKNVELNFPNTNIEHFRGYSICFKFYKNSLTKGDSHYIAHIYLNHISFTISLIIT